eukprot:jgi/Picsp_1/4977/NSC_02340-R1_hypothetical protein CHLNCDRAFT_140956 [Chlorella variabilis]
MRPFLTAIGVGIGSMAAMGGATIVVSGVAMAVAKQVTRATRMKHALPCAQCRGEGFVICQICMGTCVVRCRAPRSMKQLLRESDTNGGALNVETAQCSCPACGTSGWQRCLNCLGSGKIL